MFTTQFKSIVVAAAMTSTAAMATTTQVEAAELADITAQFEQAVTTQTQEMLKTARQELVLSLRLQAAEAMADLETQVATVEPKQEEKDVILTSQKPE